MYTLSFSNQGREVWKKDGKRVMWSSVPVYVRLKLIKEYYESINPIGDSRNNYSVYNGYIGS